jgi:hypothetical protein
MKEIVDFIRLLGQKTPDKQIDISYLVFTETQKNVERRLRDPKGIKPETIWIDVIENMKKILEFPTPNEIKELKIDTCRIITGE